MFGREDLKGRLPFKPFHDEVIIRKKVGKKVNWNK
jgi:hypothetical protein